MSDHTNLTTASPAPLLTREELGALIQDGDITTVMVGVPDMWGRLKGKRINALLFQTKLPAGPQMCAYVLASNLGMAPLAGYELTGWHDGFGDLLVVPDLSTIRRLSYMPGTALVHGDAVHTDGRPVHVAPRRMLRNQLEALAAHGLEVQVGIESEFLLYKGTETQVRRTGYRGLKPAFLSNLDYSLDHPHTLSPFFDDLQDALRDSGAPVEAIKTEGALGQIEVTWPYGDAMRACDDYTVHQHAVRHLAAQHRMTPTWLAAPQTGVGSGLHLHVSLWCEGKPVFAMQPHDDLPELLQHSIAGLISAMPQLAPLYAPTPNSYKRYGRQSFAPTNYTWGRDNRTCAIRVMGQHENTHLENRMPGADANPYLALAATIAAIIHGITNHPMLPDPCTGNAYDAADPLPVPRNLEEALTDFHESTIALRAFGPLVVRHYAHAAQLEIDAHHGQVTDVELQRGFLRA